MKKLLLIIGFGLSLFGQDKYFMNCEDIKEILPNISNTKLLIQYEHNIICKAIMEDNEGCLVFKYDLDYKTRKFEIIQNKHYLINKLKRLEND